MKCSPVFTFIILPSTGLSLDGMPSLDGRTTMVLVMGFPSSQRMSGLKNKAQVKDGSCRQCLACRHIGLGVLILLWTQEKAPFWKTFITQILSHDPWSAFEKRFIMFSWTVLKFLGKRQPTRGIGGVSAYVEPTDDSVSQPEAWGGAHVNEAPPHWPVFRKNELRKTSCLRPTGQAKCQYQLESATSEVFKITASCMIHCFFFNMNWMKK